MNLFVTAIEVYFFAFYGSADPGVITRGELWLMSAINIVLAVLSIFFFGRVIKERLVVPPVRLRQLETIPGVAEVG